MADSLATSPQEETLPHPAPELQPAAPLIAPSNRSSQAQAAAQGANDFAFRLAAALARDIGDDNLVVSPYSVWLPLAALVNATMEPYQSQLLEALGGAGLSASDINQAASRMLFHLTDEGNRRSAQVHGFHHHDSLHIANAVFIDNSFTIRPDFAQTYMDFFRGEILNAPFPAKEAIDLINNWAYFHTQGLIPSIVSSLDPDAIAVIINAIFFSDKWMNPFPESMTHQDIFHGPVGEGNAYFMELAEQHIGYFEDEHIQAVNLHFLHGGALTILLPRSGSATELLASMTGDYFAYIQEGIAMTLGRLVLPRFTIEHSMDNLAEVLAEMGIPLFDGGAAPLTGGLVEEPIPVWISNVIQKAMIDVDEEGTTAAAVTAMEMVGSALPPEPEDVFEMICNRPFVFVLHRYTLDGGNQVLFAGVVNRP